MSLTIHWVNQFAVSPDQPGGTRHFDMAKELRRRGHDVRIVASDLNLTSRTYSRRASARSLSEVEERIDGVPFTWLTAGSYQANDWRRVASMFVFAATAFAYLVRRKDARRSVFIGSSPQLFAALATWLAAAVRRAPFVLEVRDLWPESYSEMTGKTGGVEVRAMRLVADWLYRRARLIVVLAEPNMAVIAARGVAENRLVYVPNGVDLSSIGGDAGGEPPVVLGRPGSFTFVYAGAHGPANGLDVVVRACAELEARGRGDVRVALLGDGPAKGALRELASSLEVGNLDFHDPVRKASIGAVLATAEAGLMVLADVDLFSYGVSPNKLFDYLGVGLPVVTNVPGLVAEIVQDAGVGLVAKPGQPGALADAMASLADSPPAGAAEQGRAYIAEHFERRRLAWRLEEQLAALTGS